MAKKKADRTKFGILKHEIGIRIKQKYLTFLYVIKKRSSKPNQDLVQKCIKLDTTKLLK